MPFVFVFSTLLPSTFLKHSCCILDRDSFSVTNSTFLFHSIGRWEPMTLWSVGRSYFSRMPFIFLYQPKLLSFRRLRVFFGQSFFFSGGASAHFFHCGSPQRGSGDSLAGSMARLARGVSPGVRPQGGRRCDSSSSSSSSRSSRLQ